VTRPGPVFTPVGAAIALVLIATLFALYSIDVGLHFLPRLNIAKPFLAQLPPALDRPPNPLSERVVLVVIDGLGLGHSYGLPYLDSLRRVGVDTDARSHPPTLSRPNYVSIVTGVEPHISGVRTNDFHWPVALDSIMDRLRERAMESAYASPTSNGFAYMFAQDMADVRYAPWPGGFLQATRLAVGRRYPLVILIPGDVDHAAHLYGTDSPQYRAATARVDDQLRRGLQGVDLRRDTIIVTADHGHIKKGGHGGTEPAVLEVPLIIAGAGVRPGALVRRARLIDIAPTVAALLGVPAPGHGLGRTLLEALTFAPEVAANLQRIDEERRASNQRAVDEAKRQAAARVDANRARRVSLVVSAVALAIILLVLGSRWHALHIDWRVLAFAVPAFPTAFYALLSMAGHHFSLSALPDEGLGARRLLQFGLASTVVHVVATWIALGGRIILRDRLAAANALTLCGLLTASIPAALAWAVFGAGPYVQLPGPKLLFLIPAMYLAVACYAIAAAVTLSLEVVIFFSRAVDPRSPVRRAERKLERARRHLSAQISVAPRPGDSSARLDSDAEDPSFEA
jgi:2,3-bisphosphoglycerate-independent phosphoglycerate mutase